MCLQELRQNDQGFSLIEVILAVAILALVTLPIINYFTYSGVRTAKGRDKQSATVVAENVLDELNSYDNFEQIENIASNGAVNAKDWTVMPDPSNPEKFTYTDLTKKVQMNGLNYEAKVHISYKAYNADTKTKDTTHKPVAAEYNDYKIPNPSQIYGKESVVAKEDDQLDVAISHFMTNETANSTATTEPNGTANSFDNLYSTIQGLLQRVIAIHMEYTDNKKDTFRIKISYLYKMVDNVNQAYSVSSNSKDKVFEVPLEISEVKKDTLKNIYLFYNLSSDTDELRLTLDGGTGIEVSDIKNIRFYMAGLPPKNDYDRKKYKFNLSPDSTSGVDKCWFYFNGETTSTLKATEIRADADGVEEERGVDFVPKETKKRIGAIEVKVFEEGGKEPLATVNTTISE